MDHKPECKALKKHSDSERGIPDVEVRMLGRIVYRHKLITLGEDKMDNFYLNRSSTRSVMEIWSHDEDMRKDAKAVSKFRRILTTLMDFYDGKYLLDSETIFQLHCRNYINRHAINDRAYLREIGKGLYLDMCAYDHSCAPNTVYTCDGFVAALRPLQKDLDIRDKSKTFYTYIDLMSTKQERRRMLQETWYFHCECTRCADPAEHVLTAAKCMVCGGPAYLFGEYATEPPSCKECETLAPIERVEEVKNAMCRIDRWIQRNSAPQEESLQVAREMLHSYEPLLHAANLFYVRLLQHTILYLGYDASTLREMLQYHEAATACLRICFPDNHPALSYHFMNLGRFCVDLERWAEARRYLELAKQMIDFALGSTHTLRREVDALLSRCAGKL